MEYQKAKQYILDRLEKELSPNYYYHCLEHTLDVLEATKELARLEGIEGEDLILLKTAVLFHDSGFLVTYQNHEQKSIQIAGEVLPQFRYTPGQIEQICGMVLATKIPQNPSNHLEEVICDADLDYLGRDDYYSISEKLKMELEYKDIVDNEAHWVNMQIKFLEDHDYFTLSARNLRREEKAKRLEEIKSTGRLGS